MKTGKIIFIGPSGGGRVPKNGASAKNYHLLKFLRSKNINCSLIDTEDWKKNPIVLFKLLVIVLFNADAKYILDMPDDVNINVKKLLQKILEKVR